MAINNSTVVPRIIAASFLRQFRTSTVYTARTNNTWRNLLNGSGDTVIINTTLEGAVGDYTKGGTVTYTDADVGPPLTLTLDKAKSWAIKFDDLDAAKSSLPVLNESTREHALKMALTVDADIYAAMSSGAAAGPAVPLDHSATLELDNLKLSQLHRILDLQSVPRDGRWIIVGPYTAEYLQRLALKTERMVVSDLTQSLVNGRIGSFGGFTWYVDLTGSNVGNPAANGATQRETWLFGVNEATAFIDQIRRTEQLRLQNTFADAVRGLYTYGAKVLAPEFRAIGTQNQANVKDRLFKSACTLTNVPT